jgi:hypothetical protein
MKFVLLAILVAAGLIIIYGSPIAREKPVRDYYYESPEPILPMSFAHEDHVGENCIVCHHNYNDDTGGGPCMNCHTTNQDVWPLFEKQYHDLCRTCHEEKAALGEAGGPPRHCIECHRGDDLP